jgi:hypothetical protein
VDGERGGEQREKYGSIFVADTGAQRHFFFGKARERERSASILRNAFSAVRLKPEGMGRSQNAAPLHPQPYLKLGGSVTCPPTLS